MDRAAYNREWRKNNPHYTRDWMRRKRRDEAFRKRENERLRNNIKLGRTGIIGRGTGGRLWRAIVFAFLGL